MGRTVVINPRSWDTITRIITLNFYIYIYIDNLFLGLIYCSSITTYIIVDIVGIVMCIYIYIYIYIHTYICIGIVLDNASQDCINISRNRCGVVI